MLMLSLQQGFLYGLLALGVYLSFRILDIPDLTTEGSFTLGLAVSAMVTLAGQPVLSLPVAFLAGMAAGAITALLQTKVGVPPILSGIITMSGLYTVNLMVMNSAPNVTISSQTVFRAAYKALPALSKDAAKLCLSAGACLLVLGLLILFFKSHLGLCIRATGDNPAMVRSSSINVSVMKLLCLALSNGCVALSGAMVAQYQGYADISGGVGMVVVGLASVIIGEALVGRRGVTVGLCSAILGSVVYRFILSLALSTDLFPAYALKLVSACIVALALCMPTLRRALRNARQKREAQKC